jgi:60 kDa SS-A/Ro ribonucleoprotein
MTNYASQFSRRGPTLQTSPIPGKNMSQNNAGGFSFVLDDWARLDRFLILGAEGGTFYVGEHDLVKDNHDALVRCLKDDGVRTVMRIMDISESGRAPKNDPAIFALALAFQHGDLETKLAAVAALPKVCRIGTHLFHFCNYVSALRGWGSSLRRAVSQWYIGQDAERLALQIVKYQSRDGWSHRDCLRLAHPKSDDKTIQAILRWAVGGKDALGKRTVEAKPGSGREARVYSNVGRYLPEIIEAFEMAKAAKSDKEIVKLITEHDLPRECIPTQFLNSKDVWAALLLKMPITAMVRNLAKMTAIGLIAPFSEAASTVRDRLADEDALRKSRIHPLQVLTALKTYEQGHGDKGSLRWEPVQTVSGALDSAFYASFHNVMPTGKNILYALDVSGSMSCGNVAGSPLTPRDASAALALVLASTEQNYHIMGFSHRLMKLDIRPGMRLTDAIQKVSNLPFEATDCALPMIWASQNKVKVDAFVTLTDSETWCGNIHPTQALANYRKEFIANARNIVVGMTATSFTVNDPADPLGLDVVGFDAAVPSLIGDFIRGPIIQAEVQAPAKKPSLAKRKLKRAAKRAK